MQQYLFYYKLMIYVETIDCSFCLVIFAYTYVTIIINSKYCSLKKRHLLNWHFYFFNDVKITH